MRSIETHFLSYKPKAIGYRNPVECSSAGFFVASFGGESGFEIEGGTQVKHGPFA